MIQKIADEMKPNTHILIVGESAGKQEAREGIPFVGPSGSLLWDTLGLYGIQRQHCSICNVFPFYTPRKGDEKQKLFRVLKRGGKVFPDRPPLEPWYKRRERELRLAERRFDKVLLLGRWALDFAQAIWGVPLEPGDQGLAVNWGGTLYVYAYHPAAVLRNLGEYLGFSIALGKLRKQKAEAPTQPKYELVTPNELICWLEKAVQTDNFVAVDTETTKLYGDLMLFGAYAAGKAAILDVKAWGVEGLIGFFTRTKQLGIKIIMHNATYDLYVLRKAGVVNAYVDEDSLLLTYSKYEEAKSLGLKQLAALFLNAPDWDRELKEYLYKGDDGEIYYDAIPPEVFAKYLAWDVWATRKVFDAAAGLPFALASAYRSILIPATNVLPDWQLWGMGFDVNQAAALKAELEAKMAELEARIFALSEGKVKNPRSAPQVSSFLYDVLLFPAIGGKRTTNKATLQTILATTEEGSRLWQFAKLLLSYRALQKAVSSYIKNTMKLVDKDGRIHPVLKLHGTETGRLSSARPNLQQIPRESTGGGIGKRVRELYVARPGYRLAYTDYSQAEMRVMAAASGDEWLLQVYREGKDLHWEAAYAIFGPDATKEQRQHVKSINFGIAYGGTPEGLARNAGLPQDKVKMVSKRYHEVMRGLFAWQQDLFDQARTRGFVASRTGRIRHFPYARSLSEWALEDVRKAAINAPIQGAASDLTLIPAVSVSPKLRELGGSVVMLVHDAILYEYPAEKEAQAVAIVEEEMLATAKRFFPEVPFKVDTKTGTRWSELE